MQILYFYAISILLFIKILLIFVYQLLIGFILISSIVKKVIKQKCPQWDEKKFKFQKTPSSSVSYNKLIKDISIQVSNKIDQTLVNPVDSPQAKIRLIDEIEGEKKKNNQFKVEDFIQYLKKDKNQSKKNMNEVDEKFKNEDLLKRRKSSALFKDDFEKYYQQKESEHYAQITSTIKKKYDEIEEQKEEERYREEMKFYLIQKEQKQLAKKSITNHYQHSSKSNRYGMVIKDLLENSHAMAFISKQEQNRQKTDLSQTHIQLKKQEYLLSNKYDISSSTGFKINRHSIEKLEDKNNISHSNQEIKQFINHSKQFSQVIRHKNYISKSLLNQQNNHKYPTTKKDHPFNEKNHIKQIGPNSFPRLRINSQFNPKIEQAEEDNNNNNFNENDNLQNQRKNNQRIEDVYKKVYQPSRARSTTNLSRSKSNNQILNKTNNNDNLVNIIDQLNNKQINQNDSNQIQLHKIYNRENPKSNMSKITSSYINLRPNKLNIPGLKVLELQNQKKQLNVLKQQTSQLDLKQGESNNAIKYTVGNQKQAKMNVKQATEDIETSFTNLIGQQIIGEKEIKNNQLKMERSKQEEKKQNEKRYLSEIKEVIVEDRQPVFQTQYLVEQIQKDKLEKLSVNQNHADVYKQKIIIKTPIPFKPIRSKSITYQ